MTGILNKSSSASWLLRAGLAFVFVYAAIEAYVAPNNFLKYIPDFVQSMIPVKTFLPLFGVGEILLALWLLSGRYVHYAALVACALMIGIIGPNLDQFNVLFRNVAIGFGALALAVLEWPAKETPTQH